jgi:ribosomal protein L16/L10AE
VDENEEDRLQEGKIQEGKIQVVEDRLQEGKHLVDILVAAVQSHLPKEDTQAYSQRLDMAKLGRPPGLAAHVQVNQ